MSAARLRGLSALIGAVCIATACTTVTRTAVAGPQGASPGQVPEGGVPATDRSGSSALPGGASSGAAAGGPDRAAGASGGAGQGDTITPAGAGGDATGQTTFATCSKTVTIGGSYSSDLATGLAAVGNPTLATQTQNYVKDEQAIFQRSADYVNTHGGLGGCKVALVYHDFKSLGADGFSGESQSECADFAEDKHVFAAINTALENQTLATCMAQHHTVDMWDGTVYQPTPQDFAAYRGYFYFPDGLGPYRMGPFIAQFAAAGFFPKGVKVGILLGDDGSGTNQHLVNALWKPELEAMGITPVVFTYRVIENVSDNSATTSEFSSAVLQFKSRGIDHVLVTPDNGDVGIFFTQVAQSQDYHPRYAMTSASALGAWSTEPAGQRANALAVSWTPYDLGIAPDPRQVATLTPNATRATCDLIYKGHTPSGLPLTAVYPICDAFLLLKAALQGATRVTPAALLAGIDRLGTSFPLAGGFANAAFAAPSHYDGQQATRVMEWNESASEWQYVSGPQVVP
ncbi:MAG: ABC transporter substrate-binding protein [Acidimicrobiales bacterium]